MNHIAILLAAHQLTRYIIEQYYRLYEATKEGAALSFYLEVLDASVNDGVGNVVFDGTGGDCQYAAYITEESLYHSSFVS